ncbi:MAG: diaminopimelate epimerase [Phycisphaerales bacterium]|nr:diaminopimelate epimerase [Phycisphaerales bacterium]
MLFFMTLNFSKYTGAGNDLILIDNRTQNIKLSTQQINNLCDRHFGIGGDGLMLLENIKDYDFKMTYYNADGLESTMCGNGGRCMVMFAKHLDIIKKTCSFYAIDGPHDAHIIDDTTVALSMCAVDIILQKNNQFILNTGSPHLVTMTQNIDSLDVFTKARTIRYSPEFAKDGINVNFVEKINDQAIKIRTYERGVEAETLCCGTGVTAASLSQAVNLPIGQYRYLIKAVGGELQVTFDKIDTNKYRNIKLIGSALHVFSGTISLL